MDGRCFGVTAHLAILATVMTVFAQDADMAYVPFVVNVNATVKAWHGQGEDMVQMTVTANVEDTLAIPLVGTSSIWHINRARGRLNTPTVTNSRGNITLRLPAQSYQHAEIALHTVNGKRILRGKVSNSETATAIAGKNIAAGVYLLKVSGINGSAFTTSLTHSGGSLNINAVFCGENVSPDRKLAKSAADEWTINVSAAASGGYDSAAIYTLNLIKGMNPTQTINLFPTPPPPSGNTFTDSRDGTTYKKVTIGSQVWMAENLNYDVPDNAADVCYNNSPANCTIYGKLYNWAAATTICPSGWRLPSQADWEVMTAYTGGTNTEGTKLKAASGWSNNGNGTDDYGFSALPGGVGYSDGAFNYGGDYGTWWSASENGADSAYYRHMHSNEKNAGWRSRDKGYRLSVRCLQN